MPFGELQVTLHVRPAFRGCPTNAKYFGAFHWERRRLAGKAYGINAAVILHKCRGDADAPGSQSLDSL
jgi:hypothetical protein